MRPKKIDRRGTLKERPFSYRTRKDGTVLILWNGQEATMLGGKLAERFLEAVPEADDQAQQLLMARASGNFRKGNEKRR